MDTLQGLTRSILDPRTAADALRPEVLALVALLAGSRDAAAAPPPDSPPGGQADIADGETRTGNGLALSPTMAAMCAADYKRTVVFLRGTHAAITDLLARRPDRPVMVLYVGCGPYAMLALPLMAVFPADRVRFTLIDIHPQSIASARSIADAQGLAASVAAFETVDAGSYTIGADLPVDVILMEIIQACLASEPQVAISRHLLAQAPDALLIPEQVSVDLIFVDPGREFDLGGPQAAGGPRPRDRIAGAPVFVVDREAVARWSGCGNDTLPAATARVPDDLARRYRPMLFTRIRVYRDHLLQDYDSGLTCPRSPPLDRALQPGDVVRFHYALGRQPRLVAEVATSAAAAEDR